MTNEASYPLNSKLNGNKKIIFTNNNQHEYDNKGNHSSSKLQLLSYHISKSVGDFFYKLGYNVAKNPLKTILMAWMFAALCAIGFLNFKQEKEPMRLWVPEDSKFLINAKTIMDKFGEGIRRETVLLVSKTNVLTPEVMDKLLTLNEVIKNITFIGENDDELTFDDVCFKIPSIAKYTSKDTDKRNRRAIDEKKKSSNSILNLFKDFGQRTICRIVNSLKKECYRENFLEMWKTNATRIESVTIEEIIEKVNSLTISPESGHATSFKAMLGGVEYDKDGRIISAKSIVSNWMLKVNFSQIDFNKIGNKAGTEDYTTIDVLRFEAKFLETIQKLKKEIDSEDLELFYSSGRSFGDISSKTMFQDIDKVVYGVIFMMIYMVIVLSKYSWVEIRYSLAAVGLLNVGMAYVSGCGMASIFFSYSPVHTSLFFIIMGLGVDDIFVISSCLRKITKADSTLSLPEKIAKTMEKAGTSITITSLTDIIAFLVGGTTVLPSLKSFCIFAACCICINYIYVVTFFVACLVIDEKRIKANRNGFCPLIVHKENKIWCEPKLMERFIKFFYSKFVLRPFGKILIVLIAISITAFSAERVFKIKQKFDPMWFIPSQTYFAQFVKEHSEFYPNRGYEASIFFVDLNHTENLPQLYEITKQLKNRTDIIDHVKSWVIPFGDYIENDFDITKVNGISDSDFRTQLSKFLFSIQGGEYQANFKFNQTLECGKPAKDIKISSISFNFRKFEDRDEYLPARRDLDKLINDMKFNLGDKGEAFLFARILGNWITDEIIDEEIFRNITLAMIGVFFCTIVMIVNLQVCFLIFLCVLMSLISVGGFMQLWGLTLDLVTCISLQLSVGLCIDCAAHIGHTFLTISQGDGTKRAQKTVETIGDAVWQGGMSTMLAVSLLAFSDAYTYKTFFKVFTIVVIFALFYGTFFLPVALSVLNPKPYKSSENDDEFKNKDRELSIVRMPVESDSFLKNDTNIENA